MLAPGCLFLLLLPLIGLGLGHYLGGSQGLLWGAALGLLAAAVGGVLLLWLLKRIKER